MAHPRRMKSNGGSAQEKLFSAVQSTISRVATNLPDKTAASMISLESAQVDQASMETLSDSYDAAKQELDNNVKTIADDMQLPEDMESGGIVAGTESAIAAQREHQKDVSTEAAAVMMMSHNNVARYYAGGYGATPSMEGAHINPLQAHGSYGSIATLDAKSLPSLESFEEKETEKWREHSYTINMLAAKQHEFVEMFYKTYIATQDEAGFQLSVRRNVVWDGYKHKDQSGDTAKFEKRNVLEALLNFEILNTDSTEAIPCYIEGKNQAHFVDKAFLAPSTTEQNGEEFNTSFLKFGTGFNLVNLCQTPSRLQKGTPDHTDSLDSRVAIESVLVSLGGDPVVIDLSQSTAAQFLAERQGNFRAMFVRYRTTTMPLNSQTKVKGTGAIPAKLKAILDAGYTLKMGMTIDGDMNVETSNGELRASSFRITGALDSNQNPVALSDATLAPLLAELTVEPKGFKLEARMSNINQLERGKLFDSDMTKEGFIIPTLPPFCIQKPAQTDEEKVYPRVEALTSGLRVQIRNAGLTSLLNRMEQLKSFLGNDVPHPLESMPDLEGPGQYYVRPYYLEVDVDLLKDLNSTSSASKQADIQGLLVGKINEMLYRADMLTGYSATLETVFPGNTPKTHVAIGTDVRLPQYLMIPGDDRTTGINMNHTIASISDLRMKNKIVMSFTLPTMNDPHPMQFGMMGMIPEFMVNFDMIRDQRITNEIRMTPRYRFFNFLPIGLVVNVLNLEEATAKRTELDVNTTPTTAPAPKG